MTSRDLSVAIAEALRLLRTRKGLTQTGMGKLEGAPDFRTLSHWETRRKVPSLPLLYRFLTALDLDFRDLQDALDQVAGAGATGKRLEDLDGQVERLAQVCVDTAAQAEHLVGRAADFKRRFGRVQRRLVKLERRLAAVERAGGSE